MEDKRYVPASVGTQLVLMAEMPKRKRRVLVQCACGRTRWMYWFVLKKTPSARCKDCAYESRRKNPLRFSPGQVVGQCEVLEVIGGAKPGGHRYRVRFSGCGHERTVTDSLRQPFKGRTCTSCPVGRCKNAYGYIDWYWYLPTGRRVIVKEHRVIMEGVIGRELLSSEEVHHKNGVRDDNRLENLELWSRSQPPGQRVPDKVEYAKAILALYAPEALK